MWNCAIWEGEANSHDLSFPPQKGRECPLSPCILSPASPAQEREAWTMLWQEIGGQNSRYVTAWGGGGNENKGTPHLLIKKEEITWNS